MARSSPDNPNSPFNWIDVTSDIHGRNRVSLGRGNLGEGYEFLILGAPQENSPLTQSRPGGYCVAMESRTGRGRIIELTVDKRGTVKITDKENNVEGSTVLRRIAKKLLAALNVTPDDRHPFLREK